MRLKVLAFAQARDQLGFDERIVECQPSDTARMILEKAAPDLNLVSSMRVAVDCEYRSWDEPVGEAKELALIPPVSGG